MDASTGPLSFAAPRIRLLEVMGNAIVGGMESCVMRLVERLPRDGFDITVMAPFESRCTDTLRKLGAEIVVVPMPEDMLWSSAQLATSIVKACRIDVLHAHLTNAHMLAGLAGRLAGRPVVATIHGRQITPLDLEAHRFFGTRLCVVCQHSYFHALGMGVDPAQLICVPNGVDAELFRPGRQATAPSLRQALGLGEDTALVGFVGRLSPEKGPELFVRCASATHQQWPEAHFLFVGDGPMLTETQALAQRMGLAEHLHFVGLRDNMTEVYPQLDVLVSSSHSEAMPLAVMEAMAAGIPVVATRVGGIPDLIEQGGTGWLVGPRDVDGLAGQVGLLLGAPDMRRSMGLRGRQRALERFSLNRHIDGMAGLLSRLAKPTAATDEALAGDAPAELGVMAEAKSLNGALRSVNGKAKPVEAG